MIEYTTPVFPERHTAVVSGCGAPRGIARVTARRLAGEGWNVVAVDVSEEVLGFGAELAQEYPDVKTLALALDISDEARVRDAFATIEAEMPPVVGLANIAGIACPTPLEEMATEVFDRVLAVNCRGTMLMMKYGAQQMKRHGIGRIVNFSSITALDGGGTFSKFAYAAAKAGVQGITKGGARELGQYGINTNCLLPGPIDTDIMGGRLTEERKMQMSSNIPVGRVGQPEEVAAVVACTAAVLLWLAAVSAVPTAFWSTTAPPEVPLSIAAAVVAAEAPRCTTSPRALPAVRVTSASVKAAVRRNNFLMLSCLLFTLRCTVLSGRPYTYRLAL